MRFLVRLAQDGKPPKENAMIYEATFNVGKYTCTMRYDAARKQLSCEWDPDLPPVKSLSRREAAQYRAGRDAMMRKVAARLGERMLIREV